MANLAVRHFLTAVSQGGSVSCKASLYLPRVLGIISKPKADANSPHPCEEWAAKGMQIPPSVLLPWVTQMMMIAGHSSEAFGARAVTATLERIAAEFPQQLHFPMRMAWDDYSPQAKARPM